MASAKEAAEWQRLVRKEYFRLKKSKKYQQADTVKSAWDQNRKKIEELMMQRENNRGGGRIVWSVQEGLQKPLISRKKSAIVNNKGNN